MCPIKPKVVPILQEVHNYAGHFRLKIVLDHLYFQVYWLNIAINISEYIWDYLLFTNWAISAWLVPLMLIQTKKSYELMKIDFISLFKKFIYSNTYIYNLVDYFSRCIYPYPKFENSIDNIIILFDHYIWANPKFCVVCLDARSHFANQKFCIYY